ncbi:hypothetical protein VDG1235_1618 [Verrucomicrobiia bacterium DG1235]|nr:hypothetical protein VDG1235_1618 [Verrucomicrobiae bacterium DG1235]
MNSRSLSLLFRSACLSALFSLVSSSLSIPIQLDLSQEGISGLEPLAETGEVALRDGLALASVEDDRVEIEKQGELVVLGEGGRVDVVSFRRSFSGAVWRTIDGKRDVQVVDYEPVRIGKESKLVLAVTDGERRGRFRVELTFYPNVQDQAEAGSLINVDGVFFGFRKTGADSYEFVVLSEGNGSEEEQLEWEALISTSIWRPDTPELEGIASEGRELLGLRGLDWGTFQASFLVDYEAGTLRVEDSGGFVAKENIPIMAESTRPFMVLSSGFGSEIAVLDLVVQEAEKE